MTFNPETRVERAKSIAGLFNPAIIRESSSRGNLENTG